jgi:hypothetical protein
MDESGQQQTAVQTPFCGDLRSKNFFLLDALPTNAGQYLDDSHHCWCYHTQQVVGPDGGIVNPSRCVPGRTCYRSALRKSAPENMPTVPGAS